MADGNERKFWRWYDVDSLDNMDVEAIEIGQKYFRIIERYFRAEVRGVERVPEGAGLYVGNHSGGTLTVDSYLFGAAVYREHGIDALAYGLAHDSVLSTPVTHQIMVPAGAVRACPENARRIFERRRKALVYPGGDLDNMRPFRNRYKIVFGGRRGYMRMALENGVPIIPVVSAGSHSTFVILDDLRWLAKWTGFDKLTRIKVFPLTLSIPWGLTLGPVPIYWPWPAKVLIEILEPFEFQRSGPEAAGDEAYVAQCCARVETRMQAVLTRLGNELRRGG